MGIRLHPKENPTCYRIYRAWENSEYQYYVPLGDNSKKALKIAEKIDAKLAASQQAYELRMMLPINSLLHDDGRIIGLNRVLAHRDGRDPNDQFKLRIKIPGTGKIHYTTISIDFHGFDEAFRLAVEKIRLWRGIDEASEASKLLIKAKPLYKDIDPYESNDDKAA